MPDKSSRRKKINPHSAVIYREGFQHETIRRTYLTATMMSKEMKEAVAAKLKPIASGHQAKMLPPQEGWAVKTLDLAGRVILVLYKGFEVRMYYLRQLTDYIPEAGELFPEGVMRDPDDAWQVLDLTGPSAREANVILKNLHDRLTEENKLLNKRLEAKDVEISSTLHDLNKWQGAAERKDRQIQELRKKYEPADKIIARMAGYKYVTEKQAKAMRKALAAKKKKRGRK